jgi:hypothetical protein
VILSFPCTNRRELPIQPLMALKRTPALPQARKQVTPTLQIVVRRGALRRFALLNEKRGELPVAVLWDRRSGDRRTESDRPVGERRRAERRREPPLPGRLLSSWSSKALQAQTWTTTRRLSPRAARRRPLRTVRERDERNRSRNAEGPL